MFTYHQTTGQMNRPDGSRLGFGFAGRKEGLNNPLLQNVHNIGPIPQGHYRMTEWFEKRDPMGLCVIQLEPVDQSVVFGRAAFFIHGARDLKSYGLTAFLESSEGCIIFGDCVTRRAMWLTGDRLLDVAA